MAALDWKAIVSYYAKVRILFQEDVLIKYGWLFWPAFVSVLVSISGVIHWNLNQKQRGDMQAVLKYVLIGCAGVLGVMGGCGALAPT